MSFDGNLCVRAGRHGSTTAESETCKGIGTMRQRENSRARECLEQAAVCHRRAEQTSEPEMRAFLLRLENSWLTLAKSYDLCSETDVFLEALGLGSTPQNAMRPK